MCTRNMNLLTSISMEIFEPNTIYLNEWTHLQWLFNGLSWLSMDSTSTG